MLGSCMPFAFGCPWRVKLDKEGRPPQECPQCDNVTVYHAKATRSLRCFFLPVAPISTEERWVCDQCDWQANMSEEARPEDTYLRWPTTNQPLASREMNALPREPSATYQPPR
ncbi:hypothetical protein FOMPIDRAFT_158988 [Fomitopsis schrenkii]|uniref:Zinc-ribbon 15 domain-containing protein n=1 Tax=Fomitopsis schrenkii TaxID=2126942 RepID=S8FVM8_FOMSC|nr:hypothetical protein FOMPIDRAFT_158988 [Fomitopsis schrenkii]